MSGLALTSDTEAIRQVGALLRSCRYEDRVSDDDDVLVQLFSAGTSVGADRVPRAIADALVVARFCRRRGDTLDPTVRITVWDGMLLAHDQDRRHEIQPDTVLGVNNTTRTLASLTPRRHVGRALDLATGCGPIALIVSDFAANVVATDLSERAVRYAEVNAALNDRSLELRTGDLFEPVGEDERFDLVTANLPFVVSPDTAFEFRDGGRRSDCLTREAIAGALGRLNPPGLGVFLSSWIVHSDGSGIESWLDELDCTAVVLRHSIEDAEAYAQRWNQFLLASDPDEYSRAVQRWLEAYRSWGVDRIATGAIVVAPDGLPQRGAELSEMTDAPKGDGGAHVLRMVANHRRLRSLREERHLLDECLVLIAPHDLRQTMRYDGTWTMGEAVMALDDSAGVLGKVDPLAIHVVLRLDGHTTLGSVIEDVAAGTGLDLDALRSVSLQTCRSLLLAGGLEFAWEANERA